MTFRLTAAQKKRIKSKYRYYVRVAKYFAFGFYVKKNGYYYIKCPPYPVSCIGWRHKCLLIDHVLCRPANPLEIELYPDKYFNPL